MPPDNLPYTFESWVLDATDDQRDLMRRSSVAVLADLHAIPDARSRFAYLDVDRPGATAMRRQELFSTVWQDIVYATRGLRRARGFSLVVLFTLALGIGATTAMITLVNSLLLRPLQFPEPERIVRFQSVNPRQ